MKFLQTNENTLNEIVLCSIEKFLNLKLPPMYKKFLLRYNGAQPSPNFFICKGNENENSTVDWFLGFDTENYKDILFSIKVLEDRIPKNTFPIAYDCNGNMILISCGQEDYGKIYFWDHEKEVELEEGEEPDYSHMTLAADDFDEFLSILRDASELDED